MGSGIATLVLFSNSLALFLAFYKSINQSSNMNAWLNAKDKFIQA